MSLQLDAPGVAQALFNGQQKQGDSLDKHSWDVPTTHNANTSEGPNKAVEHYAAKRGEVHRQRSTQRRNI